MNDPEDEQSISDLSLAAFLAAVGCRLIRIDATEAPRVQFVFALSAKRLDGLQAHFARQTQLHRVLAKRRWLRFALDVARERTPAIITAADLTEMWRLPRQTGR